MKQYNFLILSVVSFFYSHYLFPMITNISDAKLILTSNCPNSSGASLILMPYNSRKYVDFSMQTTSAKLAQAIEARKFVQDADAALQRYIDLAWSNMNNYAAFIGLQAAKDAYSNFSKAYLAMESDRERLQQVIHTDSSSCNIFIQTEDGSRNTVVTVNPSKWQYLKKDNHGLSPVSYDNVNIGIMFE